MRPIYNVNLTALAVIGTYDSTGSFKPHTVVVTSSDSSTDYWTKDYLNGYMTALITYDPRYKGCSWDIYNPDNMFHRSSLNEMIIIDNPIDITSIVRDFSA